MVWKIFALTVSKVKMKTGDLSKKFQKEPEEIDHELGQWFEGDCLEQPAADLINSIRKGTKVCAEHLETQINFFVFPEAFNIWKFEQSGAC